MGALTITTLGEPSIIHGSVPCPIPIRKTLALILYLAVTHQAHPRARLSTLLWPDADAAHGLLNLRQTLLRVRQTLGADADGHLLTPGELVRLDLGPGGAVDVAQLAAATAQHASQVQRLAALRTYQGAFLAHLTLDDAPDFMAWADAQRAYWEGCYDLIAEKAMQAILDDGNADEACGIGQAWVAQRPDSETAYRLLATAQATNGDVASALLTLTTATRLWADLGLELTSVTFRLRDSLATLTTTITPARHTFRLPFSGRHEAFARLRLAYGQAKDAGPGVALVQGEAGLGKSRLIETFAQWAQIQGADVTLGHAYELSGRLPYQPLMELLRERLAREHAPDDLVEDSWLSELQRLVPELHDRYPDLPLPLDDAAAGTRLLEAVAQLGAALARRRPLLWLIEDVHWADEATRDGLLYLLRRWTEAHVPILVVCTLRSEELATDNALAAWHSAVQRLATVTAVALTPLTVDQTTQSLTTLLAADIAPELCAALHAETAGNPLYLHHVLQALGERGAIQWEGDSPRLIARVELATLAVWLPATLRDLLLRSVRRLDPLHQQVLAAAAVVGTQFGEALLVQLTEADENAVLLALEATEKAQLIRTDGRQYTFSHDKVAEAVYGDLTPARRRVYHRRALVALADAGNVAPAELARHAMGAEDWEQAVSHLQQAAQAARQIGAHEDALRFYQQILQLVTSPASQAMLRLLITDDLLVDLYHAISLLQYNLGRKAQAYQLYRDLLTEAQRQGNRSLECHANFMLGSMMVDDNVDLPSAQQLLEIAGHIAEEIGDLITQINAYNDLTYVAIAQEDLTKATELVEHAIQLVRRQAQRGKIAQTLFVQSDVAVQSGQWQAACAAMEESIVLFTADDAVWQPQAYAWQPTLTWQAFYTHIATIALPLPTQASNQARQWGSNGLAELGAIRLHLGDGDFGRAALHLAWQIFTERNEQRFFQVHLLCKTHGWLEQGTYAAALRECQHVMQTALTAADQMSDPTLPTPHCALVDAHHALWRLSDAQPHLERMTEYAANKPIWHRLLAASRWCTHHALRGDWAAAYQAAIMAQTLRDAAPTQLNGFDLTRYYETEALLRADDQAHAQADVARFETRLGTNRRYRLVWLRMRALVARAASDHAAALADLTEAFALARAMTLPGEAWQIANEQAATYAELGDNHQSQAARATAETGIAHLAAQISDPTWRAHFHEHALAQRPALR